jgi:hypothetical protein
MVFRNEMMYLLMKFAEHDILIDGIIIIVKQLLILSVFINDVSKHYYILFNLN